MKLFEDILFLDIEVGVTSKEISKIGYFIGEAKGNSTSIAEVKDVIASKNFQYICGHNFLEHDKKYLSYTPLNPLVQNSKIIDTLYLSMMFFPNKTTHQLDKPYKSQIIIENDPACDSEQAKELLIVLANKFSQFSVEFQNILYKLLSKSEQYSAFFQAIGFVGNHVEIFISFAKEIRCKQDRLLEIEKEHPLELAFILSYLSTQDKASISRIILLKFPKIKALIQEITFDAYKVDLVDFAENEFGISDFREFTKEPDEGLVKLSQREIIASALNGDSLLAILPTGGGKTFTFQLPALIKAKAYKGLTVIISPLQALMKNHVDSFNAKNQNFKVAAISGYLSPIERINTIEEVKKGIVDILYLAPEALRSNTIFSALSSRMIERFVIDEAHCFSTWGHDFRHDYKYIARFIKELEASPFQGKIPVSCFTATAKPDVLSDIKNYFNEKLGLNLKEFIASSERKNLRYKAISLDNDKAKYSQLIQELQRINRDEINPIIIYRPQNAKGCRELAQKLNEDERLSELNLVIEPFYAGIDRDIENGDRKGRNKNAILNDFIDNSVNVVVATTAFGMGIDKPDIQAVIHYDPSDSIESYMQEAGRGARKEELLAECIVFFADSDFTRSLNQLNRTKIDYSEIKRVVGELKKDLKNKTTAYLTPKQIAQRIGIDPEDSSLDYETIIKTAILELEEHEIIERGRNKTNIFATSINYGDMMPMEYVHQVLDPKKDKYLQTYDCMILVMQNVIQRSKIEPIEIDDLADVVGLERKIAFQVIADLQKEGLLEYNNDISVFVKNDIKREIEKHFALEDTILENIKTLHSQNIQSFNLRELNDHNDKKNIIQTAKKIIQSWSHLSKLRANIFRASFRKDICIFECGDLDKMGKLIETRRLICEYMSKILLESLNDKSEGETELSTNKEYDTFIAQNIKVSLEGFHHSLVYMHDLIDSFKLRRGRLIYYQAFTIEKKERLEDRTPYQKKRDYEKSLMPYYERKIESVHILIEFFNKLLRDGWEASKQFIKDYFGMGYREFKKKYKLNEKNIKLPVTQKQLEAILKDLNSEQEVIFDDDKSKAILVLAGPGSGKTKTLVHKIASLITIEGHKPEYFLMLAHSRSAVSEFRERLKKIIGSLAYGVDIFTFHSYAASIVGKKIADNNKLESLIETATLMLKSDEIKLPLKTLLVLDEYQDVGQKSYEFIGAIYEQMDKTKKIIAVGDDDQCINDFGNDRADVLFMRKFESDFCGEVNDEEEEEQSSEFKKYSLLTNYRSSPNIVNLANSFAHTIPNRMKTEPLIASNKESRGAISIISYPPNISILPHIEKQAVADDADSVAVLLRSNDEVLTIYSMLVAKGMNARYIASKDGFSLGSLDELQSFYEIWEKCGEFEKARVALDEIYKESKNLNLANQVIDRFEEEALDEIKNAQKHFLQAYKEYLGVIGFDEFEHTKADIIVSTMHKAKGKEFDSVYVGVENNFVKSDYDKRLLYVAMTRAKTKLAIHTKDSLFNGFKNMADSYTKCEELLDEPKRIIFMMGLGDISLGSEAAKKGISKTKPISGEKIKIIKNKNEDGSFWFKLAKNGTTVGVLAAPNDNDKISAKIIEKEKQGYRLLSECEIEYIVRWKNEQGESFKQLLCKIEMEKS